MLGFSERHSCFSRVDERCGNGFGRLHDISYVDERPTFTLNPFDVNGSITSVALTKDRKEWGWQQEVRLLWPLSIPDRLVGEHRLYRVPPGALESVTVGCKATCLEEIKAQLKATALATGHVSLRQAELGSSGYDFVYRIIDRNG